MKFDKFKTKDYVLIGIVTAIYVVLYVGLVAASGAFTLIGGLTVALLYALVVGGVIMVFIVNKIPKLGIFTLFTLIMMLIFTLLGMSYLPWFISLITTAILADILANSSKYQNKIKNALGYGFMQVGNILGNVIPICFFAEQFVTEWTQRGVAPEFIQEQLNLYGGISGGVILIIAFVCGFFGILLGNKILAKHFAKRESVN